MATPEIAVHIRSPLDASGFVAADRHLKTLEGGLNKVRGQAALVASGLGAIGGPLGAATRNMGILGGAVGLVGGAVSSLLNPIGLVTLAISGAAAAATAWFTSAGGETEELAGITDRLTERINRLQEAYGRAEQSVRALTEAERLRSRIETRRDLLTVTQAYEQQLDALRATIGQSPLMQQGGGVGLFGEPVGDQLGIGAVEPGRIRETEENLLRLADTLGLTSTSMADQVTEAARLEAQLDQLNAVLGVLDETADDTARAVIGVAPTAVSTPPPPPGGGGGGGGGGRGGGIVAPIAQIVAPVEAATVAVRGLGDEVNALADTTKEFARGFVAAFQDGKLEARELGTLIGNIGLRIGGGLLDRGIDMLFGSFAGGFAEGGFIGPGQFGLVGEEGPELISGGPAGTSVIPARGGGGVTIAPTWNIDATGADAAAIRRLEMLVAQQERSFAERAVAALQRFQFERG